jgi:hypothetical protein
MPARSSLAVRWARPSDAPIQRVSPSAATTTKPGPPRRDAEPFLGAPEFLRVPDLLVFAKQAGGASAILELRNRHRAAGERAAQKCCYG